MARSTSETGSGISSTLICIGIHPPLACSRPRDHAIRPPTSPRCRVTYRDPAPRNPATPDSLRYWDGSNWTAQTRIASKRERQTWAAEAVAAQMVDGIVLVLLGFKLAGNQRRRRG